MALDDMFEIVHDCTLFNKPVLNVYHVLRANSGETSGAISDAFQNSILPTIRLYQVDDVVNNELRIFNLGTSTDFGAFTLAAATGLRTGLPSPRFIAPGMRFPSRDRDIRSGFKRYAGGSEADYADGVLDATALGLINDIGDDLLGNWLASSDSHIVCNFVIIRRVCKTFAPDGETCLIYRLPELDSELEFYQPTTRLTNTDISSQVSRK